MNKKKLGVGAGAAVAVAAGALFLNGTNALWVDQAEIDGGTITAGNLDVASLGDMTWEDVSPDVAGNPTAIVLNDFKIVPGDTVEGTHDLDVALEGDNMKATLEVDLGTATGDLLAGTNVDVDATETGTAANGVDQDSLSDLGVTLTYSVTDAAGAPVLDTNAVAITDVAVANASTLELTPADVAITLDGAKDYTVKVKAVFDENTSERTRAMASAVLDTTTVTLQQVR